MLHHIHINETDQCRPTIDDRYSRNQKEDMKTAIDLLWKFRADLNKLHPSIPSIMFDCLQEK